MTPVTRDQFEIDGNEVRHVPTGAIFTVGGTTTEWGRASLLLSNGDYFARKDVMHVAIEIMREVAMRQALRSSDSTA